MIVQNPLIGRARKKIGNAYAKTLYNKNVICAKPISYAPTKSPILKANQKAFGKVSLMSMAVDKKDLWKIYYFNPEDRSRRNQFMKDLNRGAVYEPNNPHYDTSRITQIGNGAVVTEDFTTIDLRTGVAVIPIEDVNHTEIALLTERPIVLGFVEEEFKLVDLTPYLTIVNSTYKFQGLRSDWTGKIYKAIFLFKYIYTEMSDDIVINGCYKNQEAWLRLEE